MIRSIPQWSAASRRVQLSSIGTMAAEAVRRSACWRVISVHRQCFYCSDPGGTVICIGTRLIGRGPFTMLIATGAPWPGRLIRVGQHLRPAGLRLLLGETSCYFDMSGASVHSCSLPDVHTERGRLEEDLQRLASMAAVAAPIESLGILIPALLRGTAPSHQASESGLTGIVQTRALAVPRDAACRAVVSQQVRAADTVPEALLRLIGLGIGLTPAGDDFLAGLVLGLHKVSYRRQAHGLAMVLYRQARKRTNLISLAFYRALAEDRISEVHSRFCVQFGCGSRDAAQAAVHEMSRHGASSGWDTLAGFTCGIILARPAAAAGLPPALKKAC